MEYVFEYTGLSQRFITQLREPNDKMAYNETNKILPPTQKSHTQYDEDTYSELPVLKYWP